MDTETKIISVSYERLYNTGNYENVRFGAVAQVGDEGGCEEAYVAAQAEVEAAYERFMTEAGRASEIRYTLRTLERHKAALEESIAGLERRAGGLKDAADDEVPF